ncbi:NUDIX domain-containing protein [Micromonospora kangleipakensis]|uniref:NUDIX domain-containing protein n=1 Tax=Micromonospora kangleipakensis TaxID=1077942 RepID=UPI0013EF430D|nr:NUDIX domain-containing protein [Micromonospora kangleipakensis]
MVLPLHEEHVVLLRHSAQHPEWHWELPRGFGMPGADPAEDARRELTAEIGVSPTALHNPRRGLSGHRSDRHIRAALLPRWRVSRRPPTADRRPPTADRKEGITEVRLVSAAELARLIRDETIKDGFTISAYARAVLHGYMPAA